MKDKEFLMWLSARLVHIYKESPNADFVWRLNAIAQATPYNRKTCLNGVVTTTDPAPRS